MPNTSKTTPPSDHAAALKTMHKAYGHLHDIVSDIVESGRLNEGDIPDDYQALVAALAECNGIDQAAEGALRDATPETRPIQKFSVIVTRDITESAVVEIDAENPEQAKEEALIKVWNSEDVTWENDDVAWTNSKPYVTGVDPEE